MSPLSALAYMDPDGNMWTPWQSSGGFGNWMGNGGFLYNVYGSNVNSITNTARSIQQNGWTKDNVMALGADTASITAKTSGIAVGSVGVGMGAGAAVNVLSPAAATTGTAACASGGCQKAADYTTRYGNSLGTKMNQVAQNLQDTEYKFGDHAIRRIAERIGVGNESKVTNILNNAKPFEYFHDGMQKLGYYDSASKIFIGQIKDSGNITTIITNASQKYVNGLIK